MAADLHLLLGGQRSGKSRCAETMAAAWLATPGRSAVLIATARPGDGEMAERIATHRRDRASRVPTLATVEEPLSLAAALRAHSSDPQQMVVVDCLTLWLTNLLMPLDGAALAPDAMDTTVDGLCAALRAATGPVVLVSNEIGLGLSPLGREARHFVDELGRLHQRVAGVCTQVTLLVAGIEVPVKRAAVVR